MKIFKRKNAFFFVSLLILLCQTSMLRAQNWISGIIVDQETQQPIANVKIKYKPAISDRFVQGIITGADGKFKFDTSPISTGIMELLLDADGYYPLKEELFLNSIDINKVKIELKKMEPEIKRTVSLKYKNSSDVVNFIRQLNLNIAVPISYNLLELTGSPETVKQAERMIQEFDIPPKQILVQVMLITANGGERKNVEYDPKVKQIVKQLTSLFKYNYYWVIGQAEMIGMENKLFSVMSENKQSAFQVETFLTYQDDIIKLEKMKITVNKPNRAEIMTTVNVKNGETVILGSSGGENESEALITAVTAKVVN